MNTIHECKTCRFCAIWAPYPNGQTRYEPKCDMYCTSQSIRHTAADDDFGEDFWEERTTP
jgi:hypothetical protein